MRRAAPWIAISACVLAGGLALDAAGLPSSYLFAALLLGWRSPWPGRGQWSSAR